MDLRSLRRFYNPLSVKSAIVSFVNRVTTNGRPDFVPIQERIATCDNNGCLWSEKPYYFQLAFAIDRVKTLAATHPDWKTEQPLKAVLENDLEAVAASGMEGLMKLVMGSHAGINSHIGRRPIASFGNSHGNLQMLQCPGVGDGVRFCLLVHHTDADREWAYDRDSHVGRFDKVLDEAKQRDWTIVDRKRDWNVIDPFQRSE